MQKKRRVLVIDDVLPVRQALCSVLESDGFEVSACDDGPSALAAVADNVFDIVITDYRMPGMNGVDVTRYLRILFPLTFIIGLSSDDKRAEFLNAGADAFLLKPYRYDVLADLLNSKS
jgi:CheY-like chemotaxis protein